jgi:hypothetical protein
MSIKLVGNYPGGPTTISNRNRSRLLIGGPYQATPAALADAGLLTPIVDPAPYDLETVAGAHRAVETGKTRGKGVVRVGGAVDR